MGVEIERKFAVKKSWQPKDEGEVIAQGYLTKDTDKTVRVRLKGGRGFLTIKGKTENLMRQEFEYEIPVADAEKLLALCGDGVVSKRRHKETYDGFLWEIDVFDGKNAPLVMAEIELPTEDTKFSKPSWVGEELSFDKRYFNSYLAEHPFGTWCADVNT